MHRSVALLLQPADGYRRPVDDRVAKVSELLHQAGETHHVVYAIVDGADDDWASWYSQWLIELSALPDILGRKPVRSELTYLLVKLAKEYAERAPDEPWEDAYAHGIVEHFATNT